MHFIIDIVMSWAYDLRLARVTCGLSLETTNYQDLVVVGKQAHSPLVHQVSIMTLLWISL